MKTLRVAQAKALPGFTLELTLTDGTVVTRDVSGLLHGDVFRSIRTDPDAFARVRLECGTVAWESGADICPDTLIWGGLSPNEANTRPQEFLKLTEEVLKASAAAPATRFKLAA